MKKTLSSEKKDYIISQLKGELYQYHQKQIDFSTLNNQLSRLEGSYANVQEELQRTTKVGRSQTEIDLNEIKQLRSELDYLQEQLRQRMPNNNPQLLELAQMRQNELALLKKESNEMIIQQEQLHIEREELENNLQQLIDTINKLQSENQKLESDYEKHFKQNRELEQTRQDLEFEISKKEKVILQQKKMLDLINKEFRQKLDYLQQLQSKKEIQEQSTYQLDEQYQQHNQHLEDLNGEQKQLQNQITQQQQEQRELQLETNDLEKNYKKLEIETNALLNSVDEENLRKLNLIEDEKYLNVEMNRALDLIQQLTNIKQDLCEELKTFIQEDEQISNLVNRKNRQVKMLQQTEQQIEDSQSNLNNVI